MIRLLSAARQARTRRVALAAACAALTAVSIPVQAADALAEGRAAYAKGDYARAARQFISLAQAGNAEAQFRIGTMYYRGLGLREDDTAAFAWFRRAAEQGHAEAQYHLAGMYAFGHGVPSDETDPDRAAARWYFESAQQDNADAQYALGILFHSGKGVAQNSDEALKWFLRAANNGHADAQRFVGTVAAPPR